MAARVLILAGSRNDVQSLAGAREALDELGVTWEFRVTSAHRTPDRTTEIVERAEKDGARVVIACAGLANHLAGAVAARTLLPVIGVPLAGSPLGGLDSLLSTVQMPPGIPVATVAIGGARNAAVLAAEILALADPEVGKKLVAMRRRMAEEVQATDGKTSI